MKKNKAAAALIAALMLLSGCSSVETDNENRTDSTSESVSVSSETKAPETPEEFHQAMVSRSLYSLGNTTRLKAKIEQARAGEKTTVAYIGGSITEGYNAGADGCYARLSYEYFRDTYASADNAEYLNAGLSGTSSTLGMLRLERDVLSYKPDIVFVEFAVNDSQDKVSKEAYESLVRTVLVQDNAPAVVLLFNVLESGYSAQAHMKEIGEYYDLPMISAADALTAEFEGGRMVWRDYSDDGSHPHVEGHKLLCEFIANMYEQTDKSDSSMEYELKPAFKFGTPYLNAHMITPLYEGDGKLSISETGSFVPSQSGSGGFTESWKYESGGNEPLKLKVNASAFFIIYKRNKTDTMGSFDVYLNGDKVKTINTCQEDGWGEAYPEQIIKFHAPKDMEIEIRPSEENNDKSIEILGFGYASNESLM